MSRTDQYRNPTSDVSRGHVSPVVESVSEQGLEWRSAKESVLVVPSGFPTERQGLVGST